MRSSDFVKKEAIEYARQMSLRETQEQRELREHTLNNLDEEDAKEMTTPEETQFIAFLAKLIGAKKVVEVGVFTGYTTLSFALAMQHTPNAKIVALDVSTKYPSMGQKYWKKAGVEHLIDLRIQDANDSLQQILKTEGENSYDLAYIDADKQNIENYYELCLKIVKQGGVVLIDNTLWSGKVWRDDAHDSNTMAFKHLNDKIKNDKRVEPCVLTVADGLTIVRKL